MDTRSLRRLIAAIGLIDESDLLDDVSLLDQGALDSTGLVELQLCLEEEIGRELAPDELDGTTLLTVDAVIQWISERQR